MRMQLAELAAADATRRAREVADRKGKPEHLGWYVTQTVGGSDKHAIEWLKRFGFETYYPHMRKARPIPRKRQSHKQRRALFVPTEMIEVPLFPRYVFVHFDPRSGGWHEPFETAGIVGMLCYGGVPAPISDAVINHLICGEVEGAIPPQAPVRYVLPPGELVRITEGPFVSFNGTVERGLDLPIADLTTDAKIRVLAWLFGRETPVDLEISQIKRM